MARIALAGVAAVAAAVSFVSTGPAVRPAASAGEVAVAPDARDVARRVRPPAARPGDSGPVATPEELARYIADAYNAGDERALRRVTTPAARRVLGGVRPDTPVLVVRSPRCYLLATGAHDCSLGPPEGRSGSYVRLEILRGGRYGWYWDVVDDS